MYKYKRFYEELKNLKAIQNPCLDLSKQMQRPGFTRV